MTRPDPLLGDGYTTQTIPLTPDDEGPVEATLVRHAASDGERAVLYVHGFVDYFFQRELAEFYAARGYAFYALDLRKSGRSLGAHQTPYFVHAVGDYFEELDAAAAAIRADGHRQILVNGHSTGGLTAALWAHERRTGGNGPDALFLNSPFLDLNMPYVSRELTGGLAAAVGPRRPYRILPGGLSELYPRSIHRDHEGEWEFDLALKPIEGFPIRAGWLHAIRRAQKQLHRGLDVRVPALVMCSTASSRPRGWDDVLQRSDSVLDADLIARWATAIGRHVTCLRVEDGMHDLVLSAPPVRQQVYAELERWLGTYFPASAGV